MQAHSGDVGGQGSAANRSVNNNRRTAARRKSGTTSARARRRAWFETLESRSVLASDGAAVFSAAEANDIPGTAVDLGEITAPTTISDFVGSADLNDYYKVTVNSTQNIQVDLTGLSNDADLYVYQDQNGALVQIASSTFGGAANDSVFLTQLQPGSYFVLVTRFSGDTNYNLTLTPIGTADLQLFGYVQPNPAVGESQYSYFQLFNSGPDAATNVQVSHFTPAGTTLIYFFPYQGTYDPNTGIWDVGTIAPGDSAYLDYVLVIDQEGVLDSTAEVIAVTELDPDSTPNNGNPLEDDQLTLSTLAFTPNSIRFEPDPIFFGGTQLVINGTNALDRLLVVQLPGNQLMIRNSVRSLGIIPTAGLTRIVVNGYVNNDLISIDPRITLPTVIHGGSGGDTILSGGGNDFLYGEDGSDRILGGNGNDYIEGGIGSDVISGGNGNDVIYSGDGNDLVSGDAGSDLILGENGDDTLYGGAGRDLIIGGFGSDSLIGQADDDVLIGATTIYDFDLGTLQFLQSQLASIVNFNTRIDVLDDFLRPGNVFDDAAQDRLDGGLGRDWYIDFALTDLVLNFNTIPTQADKLN